MWRTINPDTEAEARTTAAAREKVLGSITSGTRKRSDASACAIYPQSQYPSRKPSGMAASVISPSSPRRMYDISPRV